VGEVRSNKSDRALRFQLINGTNQNEVDQFDKQLILVDKFKGSATY
jgi:hypothetical protein